MLVEYYEPDKLFEEVVGYMPRMAAELVTIDTYLEDEKLFRLIKKISPNDIRRLARRDGTQPRWR